MEDKLTKMILSRDGETITLGVTTYIKAYGIKAFIRFLEKHGNSIWEESVGPGLRPLSNRIVRIHEPRATYKYYEVHINLRFNIFVYIGHCISIFRLNKDLLPDRVAYMSKIIKL